jgi:uncharacterized protein Veg
MYWRDGHAEVDYVLKIDGNVIGVEVKSGRRKRQNGILAFKKTYPKARTVTLDWSSGEKFLASPPDYELLMALGN